jgi:hypothetical protein
MQSVAGVVLAQLGALLTILVATAEVRGDPPAKGPDSVQSPTDHSQQPATPPDPVAGGESSAIESPTLARRRANRLVYACHDGATPVFSDRPCGEDGERRRLEVPSPPAGGAPSTRAAAATAATRPIATHAPRRVIPDPPDRCARLERELASIDARMRQGYSAREAARLWQRWRDAKAKLREARC